MKKILLLVFAAMCWLARAGAQTATVTSSSSVLNSAGGQITLTATITYPAGTNIVTGVAVTNGGSGYTSAPSVSIVDEVGRVVSIAIGSATGSGGSGYSEPTVTLTGGGGSGAKANATTANGVITGFAVTAAGTGYTSAPTVVIADALGSGATGTASVIPKGIGTGAAATATIDGRVASIAIGSGGSSYSAPTVKLNDGGGTGATATASTNANGVITGFAVTAAGTGYTSAPTVVITDATGSDATGTASVANVVSAIAVTSPGSGYDAARTLVMLTGNGTGAAAYASVSTPSALAFTFELPAGWALVSTGGANVPPISQPAGTTKTLEYAYDAFPVNSATFTVTVSYPSGLLVNQTITPSAIYRPLVEPQLTVAPLVFTPTPVAPAITRQPDSVTVDSGATAKFEVVATGTPPPTLKWQRSTNNGATFADVAADSTYSGVTTGTLAIAATTPAMNGYKFRVIATSGDLPAVTSTAATLSVNFAPTISVQPKTQAVSTGGNLVLTVVANGFPAPNYQWKKGSANLTDGGRISGATTATLTISTVQTGDEGGYSVVVSNTFTPNATSATATVSLVAAGFSASQAVVGAGYVPSTATVSGTVTITNTFTYGGDLTGLRWAVLLPTGWTLDSVVNAGTPVTQPDLGLSGMIDWLWSTVPATGSTFTYVLKAPVGATGSVNLTALAEFGVGNDQVKILAKPDPLVVNPVLYHSADTDSSKWFISGSELLRAITLYNTKYTAPDGSKQRTGAYKISTAVPPPADGFTADTSRVLNAAVTLSRYHSADSGTSGVSGTSPPDGQIDGSELLRLITLYNTKYTAPDGSKQRTGAYKVQIATKDGYASDPSIPLPTP